MVGKKLQGLATFSHSVAFISDNIILHSVVALFFFAIVQHRRQLEFLCSNSPLLRMKSRNSKNYLKISIKYVFHLVSHSPTSMLCSPTYPIIPHTCSPDAWRQFHQGKSWKGSIWSTRNSRRSQENRPFSKFIMIQKRCWNTWRPVFVLRSCWWAGMVVIAMWKWSWPNLKVGHIFACYFTIKDAFYSSFRYKVFISANLHRML